LSGIGCLTLLAIGVGAAWFYWPVYWPELQEWWSGRSAAIEVLQEPSEELAARAEKKLLALAGDGAPTELRLSEAEVQSLVLFRAATALPPGISEPFATLQDSTREISALLNLEQLADRMESDAAERLRQLIGDTARVTALLYPRITGPSRGELAIMRLQAGLFPVPPFLIPGMITQLGFSTAPGNPRAMIVPVPPRISSVRIVEDTLIVRHAPP
jgi:hypothetical protein